MSEWRFLTSHARVLACIARDPEARLRDIALTLDITERSVFRMVDDLVIDGYVVKGGDVVPPVAWGTNRSRRVAIPQHCVPVRGPLVRVDPGEVARAVRS